MSGVFEEELIANLYFMNNKVFVLFFGIVIVGSCLFIDVASVSAILVSSGTGTISAVSPNYYAYSSNIGWINFNPIGGNVVVSDSGLTGYAWSESAGWIKLDGVINDGSGNLSGYAWGANVGWINFNEGTSYGVKIDALGNFTGWAWGEGTGWISFNCATNLGCTNPYEVLTTWRYPQTVTPVNGVCGTSNGSSFSTAPATNLCSAGTATVVSGLGPWTWTCSAQNGGTDSVTCTAIVTSIQAVSSGGFGGGAIPATTPTMTQSQVVSFVSGVLQSLGIYLRQPSTFPANQAVKVQIIQKILQILAQLLKTVSNQ